MAKLKAVLIGAGQRGADVYGRFALDYPHEMEFVAVAEVNREKREKFSAQHHIPEDMQFDNYREIFSLPILADAAVIATPDIEHYIPAKMALEKGYHVLLEKPMSISEKECLELGNLCSARNQVFMISHVLRYTPFFSEMKRLIEQQNIGRIMSIQHNENIGYFHFAHSYVRGNWRNSETSSPIILAKSCHDMDILLWLVGSKCRRISSFGDLTYFKSQNAPEGSGERCTTDCQIEHTCPFSSRKIYLKNIKEWPATVISVEETYEAKVHALNTGGYGKCVYRCDNNVADHQVTILEFENGVTATFNLSAFTNEINRTIKIMGTKGEIHANMGRNEIMVKTFGNSRVEVIHPQIVDGGHCGGDNELCRDFVQCVTKNGAESRTRADVSVQSHLMAFAAEKSRLESRVIEL